MTKSGVDCRYKFSCDITNCKLRLSNSRISQRIRTLYSLLQHIKKHSNVKTLYALYSLPNDKETANSH